MKNIVFTRIDDRLIHGQVMTAWIQYTQAMEVVIVDNQVAKDSFSIMIKKNVIPPKITLNILDEESAADYLKKEPSNVNEKTFILVKTPMPVLSLVEKGVKIKSVGIGGMGARRDRKPFYKNISANEQEIDVMKNLGRKGVKVFIQIIPDNEPINLKDIVK